jgi:hypothetical protein
MRLYNLLKPKIKRIKPLAPEIEKEVTLVRIILCLRKLVITRGPLLRLITRIILLKIKIPLR